METYLKTFALNYLITIYKKFYDIFVQDGYILCVLGPFLCDYKNNDASILKHCVNNNEQEILDWLDDDDVLILDRGFRDSVRAMKLFGFEVAMPHFLNGRKQFSLEEANQNRCITKVRWVIESGKVRVQETFMKKFSIQ